MLKYYYFIFCFSFFTYSFSQSVIIAEQNFEEPNLEWNYSTNTTFFDNGTDGFFGVHDGNNNSDLNDTGIAIKSNTISYQNIVNDFLFVNDLSDEGDNGTSAEAIISFENKNINAYQNVIISFDYEIIEFDSSDYIKYEIIEDGISTEVVTLPKNNFGTVHISINNNIQNLLFKLIIKQNGITNFAAIDNIKLQGTAIDPCSELMITEYIEGTSSRSHRNNFIELYNPTNFDINLGNYDLVKYTGANLSISGTLNMQGIIPALGTYLIEDENEILGVNSNLSTGSTVMDFTGNSKIALRNSSAIIDIIGTIGEDGNFAKDITLRRKSQIQSPNNQYNEKEWDIYDLEDTSDLNTHVSFCNGAIPEIEITGNFIEIIDGSLKSSATNNTYFGALDPSTENSSTRSFTIKNTGLGFLQIDKLEIIGINSNEFILSGDVSFIINTNDSIQFQVNFKPQSVGIKTATINIISNDASENPYNYIIEGEGFGLSNGPIMISQYYEGIANNKWLEITNISNTTIPKNTYYLALYRNEDANNTINNKPSRNKIIPAILPGETLKYSSTLPATLPTYAINNNEIKTSVCSFTGNDIIILSTTNDETCWANKVDIVGNSNNWGENKSWVRKYGCDGVSPKTGFVNTDWLIFETNEIDNAFAGSNLRIGEFYSGPTSFENNNSWSNGSPDINRNSIINKDYGTAIYGSFESCNLTINANAILNISANRFVSINNDLSVQGTLVVDNEGSILMINDFGNVNNTGTIQIHKTTTTLKKFDFTYWSSPVSNAILENVFAESPKNSLFVFNTQTFNDLDNNGADDEGNDWQKASGLMKIGKGYIAMAPNKNPFIDKQTVIFNGRINNGIIKTPVFLSQDQTNDFDDWNLIGNPYPSAIDAVQFLNNANNQNILNGTIYLWTHNTDVLSNSEGRKYSSNDYAMYNVGTGGIAAVSQGAEPTQYIASAQGFFVEAIGEGEIEFNNSMRTKLNNNNFFKESNSNKTKAIQNKVWLNLYNEKGAFSQILIGFIEGASSSYETRYDGLRLDGGNFLLFYSIVNEQNLAIQGTSLFSEDKTFPLGFTTNIEEDLPLKIAIDHTEGIIQKQDIYLYDRLLNLTHNLKISDYTFNTKTTGSFNNRFVLKFNEESIDLVEENLVKDELILQNMGDQLLVKTALNRDISSVTIYDMLGRRINKVKSNSSRVLIDSSTFKYGTILIIHVKLTDSKVFIKKFIR